MNIAGAIVGRPDIKIDLHAVLWHDHTNKEARSRSANPEAIIEQLRREKAALISAHAEEIAKERALRADAELRAAVAESGRLRAVDGIANLEAELRLIRDENAGQRAAAEEWRPLRALWRQVAEFVSYQSVRDWCIVSKPIRIRESELRPGRRWYCSPSAFWREFSRYAKEKNIALPEHLRLLCVRGEATEFS